jgi:hypothetical protein
MITENQPGKTKRIELFEILESIQEAKNKKERIAMLKHYAKSSAFCDYLRCTFDDRIQFLLPKGAPPYTPSSEGAQPSTWSKQNTKLRFFIAGGAGEDMTPVKRESIFIGMLEAVHPADALVLTDMISKKCPHPAIKKALIEEAVSGLVM